MSTSVTSSSSNALEILRQNGMLPSGLTEAQLKSATPTQLFQLSIDSVKLSAFAEMFGTSDSSSSSSTDSISSLFGQSTSSTGDASSTSSLYDAILHSEPGASSTSTSTSTTSSATSTATSSAIANLFDYMG